MKIDLTKCVVKDGGNYINVIADDKRISNAVKRMGGALVLLKLPNNVKAVLKSTTDPQVKAGMLEFCADNMWIIEGVEK